MLEFLRKRAASWFIKFIVAAITIVFIFWGIGGFTEREKDYAVKINNKVVTFQEYSKIYENLLNNYKQLFKDNLTEEVLNKLNVKQQAVDSIVERELLLQEAKRLKFKASDEELKILITNISYFQRDGKFDKNIYTDILRLNRISPKDFEESQKDVIIISKIQKFIVDSVKVSDEEVKSGYLSFMKKVKFGYIELPYASFEKEVPLKEDAMKSYFEKNKAVYKIPETSQFQIITLGSSIKQTPEISSKELEKDFEKFAKENKLKIETLTYKPDIKVELWQKSLLNKFSVTLKPGGVSEPVKTPTGIQIYKLVSKTQEKVPAFEEVKGKVIADYTKETAKQLAEKKAEELIKQLKSSDKKHAEGKETEFFSVSQKLPEALEIDRVELFKLSKKNPVYEKPVKKEDGMVVVWFKERKLPELADDEIQKYRRAYLDFKKQEIVKNYLESLKKGAKISINEKAL